MRKILGWAVVIFAGWYLFTQPHAASLFVAHSLHVAQQAGQRVATFLNGL